MLEHFPLSFQLTVFLRNISFESTFTIFVKVGSLILFQAWTESGIASFNGIKHGPENSIPVFSLIFEEDL